MTWIKHQAGSSLSEMAIATPVLLMLGLGTVQAALIYHGKTTINYATFEAARSGAVSNARIDVMRQEFGYRSAPIEAGNGSEKMATLAIARSVIQGNDPEITQLKILNPTLEAFEDWEIVSNDSGKWVIPNNHLRHLGRDSNDDQLTSIGTQSGLTLRDANLLKIEIKYGFKLKIPIINKLLASGMAIVDPENDNLYYSRNRLPMTSTAIVRMQSEIWKNQVLTANQPLQEQAPPQAIIVADRQQQESQSDQRPNQQASQQTDQQPSRTTQGPSDCTSGSGQGDTLEILNASDYENGSCGIADVAVSSIDDPDITVIEPTTECAPANDSHGQ